MIICRQQYGAITISMYMCHAGFRSITKTMRIQLPASPHLHTSTGWSMGRSSSGAADSSASRLNTLTVLDAVDPPPLVMVRLALEPSFGDASHTDVRSFSKELHVVRLQAGLSEPVTLLHTGAELERAFQIQL